MLSSCTLMSLTPVLGQAPAKFSLGGALQPRKRPAAASSLVALPWAPCKESRFRASPFACHAEDNKYNILPSALVHPPTLDGHHDDWSITEDKEHITLKLNVGESTTKDKLEVQTTEDQVLLVIRYTGGSDDQSPAKSLDVRLLMPPGYDGKKVYAVILPNGWLQITIPKPKHEPTKIDIHTTPKA